MVTCDDRAFCLSISCENGLQTNRVVGYMYLWEKLGYDVAFRYKLQSCGFCSNDCSAYLNEVVSSSDFKITDGVLHTADNNDWFEEVPMSYRLIEITNKFKIMLDNLTNDELELVCLSDFLISTVVKEKSTEALIAEREVIETTLMRYCKAYSKENFDESLKFLNFIRDNRKYFIRG